MRARPLSASSIKTYLQCPLKYFYQYEDKKPRPGKTPALAFGIAIHEALEYLYRVVSETGLPPSPEVYTKTLEVYTKAAVTHGLGDLSLLQEGKDAVISRLDAISPEEKIVGLELRFELKTPAGTPYTGSIDKLVELDEETVVVIDYKTSQVALTQPEADTDIQLSMYELAVSQLFPQYKTIVCALDYIRLGEVVTHRTPEQRQLFVEFLDAVYADICALEEEAVSASINFFCPWCDFKSYCQSYKQIITDPALVLEPVGELSDEDFVLSWEALLAAKKIVDGRQRELTTEAYERMKGMDTIKGGDKEIYKVQTSSVNYDAKAVCDVVGPDVFARMASVNKSAVDRYLRDNPEHSRGLESAASFSFRAPYFRSRKIKD